MIKSKTTKTTLPKNSLVSLGAGFIDSVTLMGVPNGVVVNHHSGYVDVGENDFGNTIFEISFSHFSQANINLFSTNGNKFIVGNTINITIECEDTSVQEIILVVKENNGEEIGTDVVSMTDGVGSYSILLSASGKYDITIQNNLDATWNRELFYGFSDISLEVKNA